MLRLLPVLAVSTAVVTVALIGINHSHPVAHPVVGIAFAEVQQAVEAVRTSHVVFRMQPDANTQPGETIVAYEAWLQAEPAAFAVLTPATRMVGDRTGIVQFVENVKAPMRISTAPVTEEAIRNAMLFPDLVLQKGPSVAPRHWGTGRIVQQSDGRTLVQFDATDDAMTRTLWVDPVTRLPVRVDMRMNDTHFSVDFTFNATPPPGVFAASGGGR